MRPASRHRAVVPATIALALVAPLLAVLIGSASAASAPVAAKPKPPKDKPPVGVVFNDPLIPGARGNVLGQVTLAVRNTPKNEYIRLVVWNFDAPWLTRELIAARSAERSSRCVTAGSVDSRSFTTLAKFLKHNPNDKSFAKKCNGACRSNSKIMHSKFFMFSKVQRPGTSRCSGPPTSRPRPATGSGTTRSPAPTRTSTTSSSRPSSSTARTVRRCSRATASESDEYKVVLFPKFDENPVADAFSRVKCQGATGPGSTAGRTKIRIAVAGWFNGYGEEIARKVRSLWDRGCDVRIVTTLLGRGVNRTLRNPAGRGPVPIRSLYQDADGDAVPERYLHMKSVSIQGVYGGNTAASVVMDGLTQLERPRRPLGRGLGEGLQRQGPGRPLRAGDRPAPDDLPQPG